MQTKQVDDSEIARVMRTYGGSFVKALGELWLIADFDNRARIKHTWPEYWQKYREFAESIQ